jgi:HNH endonuclease
MKVPPAVITSVFDADSPRLSPLRRILREAGVEVVRPARKLPRSWQRFVRSKRFARSRLWSCLRYDFLRDQDGRCRCCGHGSTDGSRLNVDHILSRKTHPQLALAYANLQLLCSTCNQGKGNRDGTDWRFRSNYPPHRMTAVRQELSPRRGARRKLRPHKGHGQQSKAPWRSLAALVRRNKSRWGSLLSWRNE